MWRSYRRVVAAQLRGRQSLSPWLTGAASTSQDSPIYSGKESAFGSGSSGTMLRKSGADHFSVNSAARRRFVRKSRPREREVATVTPSREGPSSTMMKTVDSLLSSRGRG